MITFNAETHTYTDDENRLPSVTEILKASGLIQTQFYKGTEAAERGTRVHSATEEIDTLGTLPIDYPEDIYPYLRAWEQFKLDYSEIKIIEAEALCHHPHYHYAGTFDRIVRYKDVYAVLDIKTGQKAPWHTLQLAAYALAYEHVIGYIPTGICIYLKNTGKYAIKITETDDFAQAKQRFIDIVKDYNGGKYE